MLTHAIAFELSLHRLAEAEKRATLASRLGDLPKPAAVSFFRRETKPLSCVIEVRQHSEKARIRRRLIELADTQPRSHRKAG
jgi:hypothetical protein